jgi:hypothetical protein
MKPSHRLMAVQISAERICGVGRIDKANGFRAAQGTGPIKINSRSRLIWHREAIYPDEGKQ